MLQKYGKDVVDGLESREFESKKWTREELENLKVYYRDKIKAIERGEPPKNGPGMDLSDVLQDMGEAG